MSYAETVDLIMMPTSGIGRYRWFILGSVTAKVRAAQRLHTDLVINGRSSDSGLAGWPRANPYSIIRQSPCPVVSV